MSVAPGLGRGEDWNSKRYLESSGERLSLGLPTFHFQSSLPRLPIPNLRDTVRRYLAAQRPLLSDEEYRHTESLAKEFAREASSEGWKLQRRLVERDEINSHTNYFNDFLLNMYMKDRRPLPLLHNIYLGLKDDPSGPSQVARAVNFIHSAVLLKNSLTDEVLEPDMFYSNQSKTRSVLLKSILKYVPLAYASQVASLAGAIPLDMSQYRNLFGTTRVPKRGRDEIVSVPTSRHIVVMRNSHMYCVDVQQSNGLPTDPDQLYSTLTAIASDPSPPPPHPVSILTGTDRDTWADARSELMAADPQNVLALEKVESALFIVCLDDRESADTYEVHNYGMNRWFDKSVQLIVNGKAEMAISFDLSCMYTQTVISFMDRIFSYTNRYPYIPPSYATNLLSLEKLEFYPTNSLKSTVEKAQCKVEQKFRAFSYETVQYHGIGKKFVKDKNLSPNSFTQLALQMAYHRQQGVMGSTVLPCSTATFLHGLTEWGRPGTMAAKDCIEAFQPSSGTSLAEKRQLVRRAVSHFSQLYREGMMGQGFDRHLYALKSLAKEEGDIPALFKDPAYYKIRNFVLYPSTISSEALSFGVFGPLFSEGFTIAYITRDDSLDFLVKGYSKRNVEEFCSALRIVLDEIKMVL